ncbi:RHS repeat-associated core domain-containing protein [Pasteurella sp. PK-2025]|uniref:RHS repeat-associated core domain-containing protein n=1 Tax=Pasteurella sp. PK-2025 TaxID=3413133 RepID=UPI003C71F9A2
MSPLDPQLLFAGQYSDPESGLAYNRFRYYDPESGNYISSDPIGLNGGEQPYRYVHNVLDFLDPFGLAGCSSYLKKWGKGREGFKNFWDNSSYDEFMEAWNNKSFRDNIKTRLRANGLTIGGGYHEWLPVSQADKFKQMGVSFDDYMKWRTPTNQVGFLDNLGNFGTHTPTTSASSLAHKELIGIAGRVNSISDYIKYVRKWSQRRLPNGVSDLPF